MSKYSFSQSERFAVFATHGPTCYICRCPIDLQTMHVDHIIPEHLPDERERFEAVLRDFDLPADFNVNSFENWLPSCAPCNVKKGSLVFRVTLLAQINLDRATKKAESAREHARKTVESAVLTKAVNTICRANESTTLTAEILKPIVESMREHNPSLFKGFLDLFSGGGVGSDDGRLGFGMVRSVPARIPLTPFHTILAEEEWRLIVSAPYGTGFVPKPIEGAPIDGSFYCGHCGSVGPWSGARCLSCGYLSDE